MIKNQIIDFHLISFSTMEFQNKHGMIFLNFQAPMLGVKGAKNYTKKYNIDYFGYAANLEVKFKLDLDEDRGSKIEKKVKFLICPKNLLRRR